MNSNTYTCPTIKTVRLEPDNTLLNNSDTSPNNLDENAELGRSYNADAPSYSRQKTSIWVE